MPDNRSARFAAPTEFPSAAVRLGSQPLVAFHNDADGLSAGTILLKSLERLGLAPDARIVGKGENAFSQAFVAEIVRRKPTGLVIADLGVSDRIALPNIPIVLVDHHIPTGIPKGALVVSGANDDPIPTSSLLAYRCSVEAGVADDLLWLAALGIIGDMAEEYGFGEMAEARARYGVTVLRKAASLINAPRRTATGDAGAALRLLVKAEGPTAVLSGEHPETEELLAAKAEVNSALAQARKVAPKFAGEVALIIIDTPCQVHPLIAQQWRGRLKTGIVIAANVGYRPGWVHFAARSPTGVDVLAFLASVRPPGADEQYGNGHRAASGGALNIADWGIFLRSIGFETSKEGKLASVGTA